MSSSSFRNIHQGRRGRRRGDVFYKSLCRTTPARHRTAPIEGVKGPSSTPLPTLSLSFPPFPLLPVPSPLSRNKDRDLKRTSLRYESDMQTRTPYFAGLPNESSTLSVSSFLWSASPLHYRDQHLALPHAGITQPRPEVLVALLGDNHAV